MEVLNELRILSSADFDAKSLLTVVLAGDGRLLERLQHPDLVPLATRIRTRLCIEAASREELSELLDHALAKAGNAALMTAELREHVGRPRQRQLSAADDHGRRTLGLRHDSGSCAVGREVLPGGLSADTAASVIEEESEDLRWLWTPTGHPLAGRFR